MFLAESEAAGPCCDILIPADLDLGPMHPIISYTNLNVGSDAGKMSAMGRRTQCKETDHTQNPTKLTITIMQC